MTYDDFEHLFRELYVPAYTVALRLLRDEQEAEDAASEARARTASSWQRLRGLEHQRAWVLRGGFADLNQVLAAHGHQPWGTGTTVVPQGRTVAKYGTVQNMESGADGVAGHDPAFSYRMGD